MLYGHRRNVDGYAQQLENIDQRLPEVMKQIGVRDLLMIVSDHGNDPSFKGTDHTREFVPLLVYNPSFLSSNLISRQLGTRSSFCDLGQTILENFGLKHMQTGNCFNLNLETNNA